MQGSSDRNASPVPSDMSTTTTSTQLSHSFGMQTSELTMFQQRCSICFEAQLDFCLERCRDQFCRECFSRYVSETIGSAWGMATPKVKCPVCSDPLAREDWAKFVKYEIAQSFDRRNHPFKCLVRGCPKCAEEAHALEHFEGTREDREGLFDQVHDMLNECLPQGEEEFLNDYQTMARHHLNNICLEGEYITVTSIYHFVMKKLNPMQTANATSKRGPIKRRRTVSTANPPSLNSSDSFSPSSPDYSIAFPPLTPLVVKPQLISSLLASLENRPEEWRMLQFEHISHFPQFTCASCSTDFCFQCGTASWHTGQTCMDWMKQCVSNYDQLKRQNESNYTTATPTVRQGVNTRSSLLRGVSASISNSTNAAVQEMKLAEDEIATMQWKVVNSKSCPRCCILINRDDGCNKVDCTMCGMRFCWICRSPWSEKCGFYKCQIEPTTQPDGLAKADTSKDANASLASPSRRNSSEAAPELGVPDVARIQARLSVSVQRA